MAYEAVQAVLKAIDKSKPSVNRENIKQKLFETGSKKESAANSDTIQGISISFDENGDRKELQEREIATAKDVDGDLKLKLVKGDEQDVSCDK